MIGKIIAVGKDNEKLHRYKWSAMPTSLIFILALYAIVDSIYFRTIVEQRYLYAALISMTGFIILVGADRLRFIKEQKLFIGLWFVLTSIYFVPVFSQDNIYPKYIVGDYTSLILPILLFIAGIRYKALFESRYTLLLLACLLILAAILSIFFGQRVNNRFEAPPILLIPLGWLAFGTYRKIWSKSLLGLILFVLLVVILKSGERTGVVLWIISGLYIFSINSNILKILSVLIAFTVIFLFGFNVIIGEAVFEGYLNKTRFKHFAKDYHDRSLDVRINEAQDAVLMMQKEGTAVNHILGFGHGASYRPVNLYNIRNITKDGSIHNIHIGPVLIYFRYGILGVVLYGCLLLVVAWSHVKLVKEWRNRRVNILYMAFAFSLVVYLINNLLRNVIVDPIFSYVLAGFLYYRFTLRDGLKI